MSKLERLFELPEFESDKEKESTFQSQNNDDILQKEEKIQNIKIKENKEKEFNT